MSSCICKHTWNITGDIPPCPIHPNGASLFSRKHFIEDARKDKQQELMVEYDKEIYHPALKALREECGKQGHKANPNSFHQMANYEPRWYCNRCGMTMESSE